MVIQVFGIVLDAPPSGVCVARSSESQRVLVIAFCRLERVSVEESTDESEKSHRTVDYFDGVHVRCGIAMGDVGRSQNGVH